MGRHDGKTEKATPRRRERARQEGNVARSQEVGVAVSLAAAVLAVRAFGGHGAEVLGAETRLLLSTLSAEAIPGPAVAASAGRMTLALSAPVLAAVTAAGLLGGLAQVGFRPAPKAAKPKLSRLSPKKGLDRLRPSKAGWELLRTAVKLGLLVAVVWAPLSTWAGGAAVGRSLDAGLVDTLGHTWTLLLRVTLLAAAVAAADYAWSRRRTSRELRMSKDEVRREHKDSEGDPQVRGARRRRQVELSRNRMLREVVAADVVVTNPTHLAVALRYADGEPAPRVVAKGADRLAARIRALAGRHGVPVTQDKALARALYRRCRLGGYVPAALYEAVAAVLAVAYRRRGTAPGVAAGVPRAAKAGVAAGGHA